MAIINFPPLKEIGIADGTCPCILTVTPDGREFNIDYCEIGLGEGRTGELKGILENPLYLTQLLNNIWRNLAEFEFTEGLPNVFKFNAATINTPIGIQLICYGECDVTAYHPTKAGSDNDKYIKPESHTVTYSLAINDHGLFEPNSFKRIEQGVIVLYKGDNPELMKHAWGVTWDDGRSRSYGWVPASSPAVEISDPRHCTSVTDLTHEGSGYREELLNNGVLKKVNRTTTVEVVA